MDDKALYAKLLGLMSPWGVEKVELKLSEGEVHVWVALPARELWVCPDCLERAPIHDHRDRVWRHLDTFQYKTLLHARVPRLNCPTHGVKQISVPWAEDGSRFTALFEALAIDWMKQASISAIGDRLRLSWDETAGIQERAVRRLYIGSVTESVPRGVEKIVFDKFHIAKHLNDAVDKVRRRENRVFQAEGKDWLKGTKYDWLRHPDRFSLAEWRQFLRLTRRSDLKTARAWSLKEEFMRFWDFIYQGAADRHFRTWHAWAIRSRLEPIKTVAHMIATHYDNIVTYFQHPITNAAAEGLNASTQRVKAMARGFRNPERFRNAIYFHCGGLDLYPETTPFTQ